MAIKLEVGKTYLQRDGTRIRCDFIPENPPCSPGLETEPGPIMALCTWWNSKGAAFSVHKHLNGRVYPNHSLDHQWDIVSEYTPPMEIWVNEYGYEKTLYAHRTFEDAERGLILNGGVTKHFREVIE